MDTFSASAESMIVSVPPAESMILSALFGHVITLSSSGGYKKDNNQQYWQLLINNFGQLRLNGAANQFAAKGGQVLPQFKHIVSGALTPTCPIMAVF
jgi:hypothetical protein